MQSVSPSYLAATAEEVREVTARVVVDWTRNATQALPSVSASETKTGFSAQDVAYGYGETYRWAVCDQGCLADGTWYPAGYDDQYPVGWWSSAKADASGRFAASPILTVTYPEPRYANYLVVATTEYYPGVTEVRLEYQEWGSSTWEDLGSQAVTDTELWVELPGVLQLSGVRVTVTGAPANDYARLVEIDAVWREELDVADLQEVEATRQVEPFIAGSPCYGSVGAGEGYARVLGGFGWGSTRSQLLAPGLRFAIRYGLRVDGSWVYLDQGTYYLREWTIAPAQAELRGLGLLSRCEARDVQVRALYALTPGAAIRSLLYAAGVPDHAVEGWSELGTTATDWLLPSGQVRAALQAVCLQHGVWLVEAEGGGLRILPAVPSGAPVATVTDAELFEAQLEVPERYGRLGLVYVRRVKPPLRVINGASSEEELDPDSTGTVYARPSSLLFCAWEPEPDPEEGEELVVVDWALEEGELSADVRNAGGSTATPGCKYAALAVSLETQELEVASSDWTRRLGGATLRVELAASVLSRSAAQTRGEEMLEVLTARRAVAQLRMPAQHHWQVGDLLTLQSTVLGSSEEVRITRLVVRPELAELEVSST